MLGTARQLRGAERAGRRGNGLGTDLVVQTPYGDSGKTTFFIKSEADWDDNAEDIVGQELKVMKRINNKAAAVEACITRHGTIVGPFMTDLTGYPELTPVQGRLVRQRPVPRGADRRRSGPPRSATSAGWATGSRRRATRASSRSTCWSTSTPTRSTSAS